MHVVEETGIFFFIGDGSGMTVIQLFIIHLKHFQIINYSSHFSNCSFIF
jgi:hypothetical protein